VIVGDDEFDPGQPPRLKCREGIASARPALSIGELDGENLAPAVLVDRHRNQHRLAENDPSLAHLLVTGVSPSADARRRRSPSSSDLLITLIDEAEKRCPHNASVTALTLRVETPCTSSRPRS
jgi:hypothetical protein